MTKSAFLLLFSNILKTLLLQLVFIQSSRPATAFHPTNETDKLALLAFKDGIHDDPLGVMDSWNESFHFCKWIGVSCSSRHDGRVARLSLASLKLVGLLPPHIGNLSFLRYLDLNQNFFKSEIPQEVGHLFRLRVLDLSYNRFQGEIPTNLSSCSKLLYINFNNNELTGEIPTEPGNLLNVLGYLYISSNQLRGNIPRWLGNASSLQELSLGGNNLHGTIPDELGRLAKLQFLQLSGNHLSGKVPSSIFNLSSLYMLSVAENQLHGRLPNDIGFTLPNLEELYVNRNHFYGEIPLSFLNATKLKTLGTGFNNLSGVFPSNLGSLWNLEHLSIHSNHLETAEGEGLSFIVSLTNCSNLKVLEASDNLFKGALPAAISNLSSKLYFLNIGSNQISGKIPEYIGNLVGLSVFQMSEAGITGEIPSSIGKLKALSFLSLSGNKLSGPIPSSLGNITQLQELRLQDNNFSGSIPPYLGNCTMLGKLYLYENNLIGKLPEQLFSFPRILVLNLQRNSLSGQLALGVGNLTNLVGLSVADNLLSGKIPSSLGNCLMLEELYMEGNLFEGVIPTSFSSLKSLNFLDLSRNNLSGQIPEILQNFTLLEYLNLSFNNFVGNLPIGGVFGNASAVSVTGNQRLCGGIHQLGLPQCEIQGKRRERKFHQLKAVISVAVTCSILLVLVVFLVIFLYTRRSQRRRASSELALPEGFPQISYAELSNATNDFSPSNLIGEGSFGSVYRGILGGDEKFVAIKVLNLLQKGASKSFIAECEALRNIRHRNLIKIVTVCSSIDFKGNDFKALVYELMQNGSLEEWLHPSDEELTGERSLSFVQRLNIAIDVACALEYLHDHCQPSIVHGDIKPSNILLDKDMVAHVGDFGLARFLTSSHPNQSSSIGVKGTIGYLAPEYGMNMKASKPGDVYGFGILLLEMITGKRPTDAMFKDGFTIHQFTKTSLPDKVVDVLESSLLQEVQDAKNPKAVNMERRVGVLEGLVAIARIGVLCSMEPPNERMEMKEATAELCTIRDSFLVLGTC